MRGKIIISLFMCLIVVLTFIFVLLRLLNLISWNWIWVICPVWIPAAILLLATLILIIIGIFTDFKE